MTYVSSGRIVPLPYRTKRTEGATVRPAVSRRPSPPRGATYAVGVDRPAMRRLVRDARVGHLATVSAEGLPHVVPVCYALLADTAYTAVDHKPKRGPRLRRIANIEATGRACLLVDSYDEDWSQLWWVRLDGRARVAPDTASARAGLDALVSKYEQYSGRAPAGPVIVLDVDRWSGWCATA